MKPIVFICIFMIGLLCSLILGSCARTVPSATPEPLNFELEELLLDTSSLPSNWRVSEGPNSFAYEQGQKESQYIKFIKKGFKSPRVIHIVFLYQDEGYATEKYSQYLPAYFDSAFLITYWKIPNELNYQSDVADQFRFRCADFQNASTPSKTYVKCVAMGQYGRIVSVFSTYISPDSMSYADLERVLKAIDERMAAHLKDSS